MTLEDFFTLTEIKDGLTAPYRVEELVSTMQKERDSAVKITGDASRQWGAVASTIAATKNRDCLDVFMQLDGLQYFNGWLKDAQQLNNDSVDSAVEDSIIALLGAVENLQIESEKAISSGIQPIVGNLTDHGSTRVKDLARALFDSWKQNKTSNHPQNEVRDFSISHNLESKANTLLVGQNSKAESSVIDLPRLKQCDKEQAHVPEVCEAEAESLPFSNSEEVKSDQTEALAPTTGKIGLQADMILGCPSVENKTLVCTPCDKTEGTLQEHSSVKGISSADTAPAETTHSSINPKQNNVVGPSDASTSGKVLGEGKQVDKAELLAVIPDAVEPLSDSPTSLEPKAISDAVVGSSEENRIEPVMQNIVTSIEEKHFEPKSGMDDVGLANNCSKQVSSVTHQDSKYDSSPNSYGKECGLGKPDNLGTPSYSDVGKHKGDKDRSKKKRRVDRRNSSRFSRSVASSQAFGAVDRKTTDLEFDYGIVDALEVATRVAQEVAREVDSREPSFNSSENLSGDSSEQMVSTDSSNGEQDNSCTESPAEEVPSSENHLSETPREDQDPAVTLNNPDIEPEQLDHDPMVSSRVANTAEQVVSAEKGLCYFDLNEEVCVDDTDHAMSSISTPIPVVSAPRPAAVSGLPSTPLQFVGALGWKGSAATSAFRPASPRRISDAANGDKSAKHKQCFLGIDLNVADGIDDGEISITSGKPILVPSSTRSAESSVETKPGKSERFKLDLNCGNDQADTPPRSDFKIFLSQGNHQSASPASSSSVQHSAKSINIDLNDRPQFQIGSSDQGRYLWSSTDPFRGGDKPNKPVISLFGTKVEVDRQDLYTTSSSGKSVECTMDHPYMGRTGNPLSLTPAVSYLHPPMYGYNGVTASPGLSFSSPIFVPGSSFSPYMMDPRGAAPVFSHVIGSRPPGQPTYPQPPFMLDMVGGSLGLNGSGPIRPGFDLNSGFGFDVGNREASSFGQFLMPGQIRPVEEYSRGNSQGSSSSIAGGKRKEPESGWEPYTLNSRPQQPPWR